MWQNCIRLLICIVFLSGQATAQASTLDIRPHEAAATCGAQKLQIQVTVVGVSKRGILTVELYRPSSRDFLRKASRLHRIRVPAAQGRQTVCFNIENPGSYAVAAYHDLDADRSLDRKWNKLPDEPFALSNNKKLELGFPKFEDAAFSVGASGAQIVLELQR